MGGPTWFIRTHNAAVVAAPPPAGWEDNRTSSTGEVTFATGVDYPGFIIDDPVPDWTGRAALRFAVYSAEDTSVTLHMTVEDHLHNREYTDRFNRSFTILPGANRVSIPLEAVESGPTGRPMDMRSIANINVFVYRPARPVTLYFDDFRLE